MKLSHLLILLALISLRRLKNNPKGQDRPSAKQHDETDKEQSKVNIHQSFPAQPITADQQWRTDQRKNWRRQLWPQWVLAGTAVVASVIGIYTLYILNRTLKATEIASSAAIENVKIFRQEQRAWLGVKQIFFQGSVTPGSRLYALIQVENTGKTPALEVGNNRTITFEKPTKEHIHALPKYGTFSKIAIAPSGVFVILQHFGNKDIERFTKETPYVFGRISYKDAFGSERQTWFCAFYSPDVFPAMRFCDTLNYMD